MTLGRVALSTRSGYAGCRCGELHRAYHEGMEDRLGVLGLVLNCVTLWNTVYLDLALAGLGGQG